MTVGALTNPVYEPGMRVSFEASAAIEEGKLVEVSGQKTVATAGSASVKVIGVALQAAGAAGDVIAVLITGYIFNMTAEGAVADGDQLTAAADGTGDVSAVVPGTVAALAGVVGVALQDIADEATGWVLVKG